MHGKTAAELEAILQKDGRLRKLFLESFEEGHRANPDPGRNPVRSLEDFYTYLDWTECPIPWQQMAFAQSSDLKETIDQAMAYFYFLLDQPLPELEDLGMFRPVLEYLPELRTWISHAAAAWGRSLGRPESWNREFLSYVQGTPSFRMEQGWYEEPANWHCFNDFFSRKLKNPSMRPVSAPEDETVCVSPADSEFQGVWDIGGDSVIEAEEGIIAKSRKFRSADELLGEGSAYAGCFAGGKMTHSFLSISDYHRYHFPVSGVIREARIIPALDAAGGVMTWDAGLRRYSLELGAPEWQSIETRGCVVVETRHFGNVAVLPIGMCQVSSVNFLEGVKAGSEVRKGGELGYFLYGGSDFMLLFEKRAGFEYTAEKNGRHLLTGQECGRFRPQ